MYWTIAHGEPEGPAVIDHMLHISCPVKSSSSSMARKFKRTCSIGSGTGSRDCLHPSANCRPRYVGHPEPSTMTRYIPGIKKVVNKYAAPIEELGFYQGLAEAWLDEQGTHQCKGAADFTSRRTGQLCLHPPATKNWLMKASEECGSHRGKRHSMNGARLQAFRYSLTGNMAPMTSIPGCVSHHHAGSWGNYTNRRACLPRPVASLEDILVPMKEMGFAEIEEQIL